MTFDPAPAGPALTRRSFLAGAAAGSVALAAGPLVAGRAAFGAEAGTGTLVVVFLRGGMDGLSVVVPAGDPHLAAARPDIAVPAGALLPLDRRFGLHPALAPLHDLWARGRLAAVPAVSTPDISRSHFQAQDCLERGGSVASGPEGWLDRVLDAVAPGSAFQGVSVGTTLSRALAGDQGALALTAVDRFTLHGGTPALTLRALQALAGLHDGLDHPLATDVATTLDALGTAAVASAAGAEPGAAYPDGPLGAHLAELAGLVKAGIGLRVACVDVGGWDMHVGMGSVDGGAMQRELRSLGSALGAFVDDIGDHIEQVTVVVMTEFGRRVEQNGNGGTDHGHGATVLVLGGGVAGGTVHGTWHGLAPDLLDQGDVPGWNDYRDILGEVTATRLGVGTEAMAAVFPGHTVAPLGVMR